VATDWAEIVGLYDELLRYQPTLVVEANRAVAVAMAQGPAAGLALFDAMAGNPRAVGWPPFHVARADLLGRLGRNSEAVDAYQVALALEPPAVERAFISRRILSLRSRKTTGR